jgi:protein-disulfide isomerase
MLAAAAAIVWIIAHPVRPSGATAAAGTKPSSRLPVPDKPVKLGHAALQGDMRAPVAVVIFSDFQCPFCGRFATQTLPAVKMEYVDKGKVLLAFKQFPLETIHPNARRGAQISECAQQQGAFLKVHDFLFSDPNNLKSATAKTLPARIGVDESQLKGCLTSAAIDESIDRDEAEGKALGIRGTPSFLIGILKGTDVTVLRLESGAIPVKAFSMMLDDALKAANSQTK